MTNDWICPAVESITVEADPDLFVNEGSKSFVMVVNRCSDAEAIDKAQNLRTYNSSYNCLDTDPQYTTLMLRMAFKSKILT